MRRLGFALLLAAASPAQAQAQDAATSAEIAELTARVEALEGHRAILNLQRAFAFYVDRGLWHDAATLFADQGSIEIGADGTYRTPARIEEYLRRLHGGQEGLVYGQLNEWITLQPLITMGADGTTATARWRDLGMLGQYESHAEWRDGIYENAYVREGGVWKIARLRLVVNFTAPYARGWARLGPGEGLARSQASRDFPPDVAPASVPEPFPAVQHVPHSAPHPVTGRAVR